MPKVSIVIPAYNAERHIEKCLLSLENQTFRDFETIVVDDGSTDGTREIASRYARVIDSADNLGVGAARNLGAREASGEILAFTDADVVLPGYWIEKIVRNLERHNVKCVGGGYCGSIGSSFMQRFAYLELAYRRKDIPEFVNTLVSNNFACYREVFAEFGGFPLKHKSEDLRLSYLIGRKYKIFWDRDNGVHHHFRDDLMGYLKQQYLFGRDTVWSYYCYPGMLLKKTHQGRGIYVEAILMFLAIASLVPYPLAAVFFLLSILILNVGFLMFLRREGLSPAYGLLLVLARDVVCVVSIFAGVALCLKDIAGRLQGKDRVGE
jgi:glycosyltransferase involved in cell wall biosynthesis